MKVESRSAKNRTNITRPKPQKRKASECDACSVLDITLAQGGLAGLFHERLGKFSKHFYRGSLHGGFHCNNGIHESDGL